MLPLIMFSKLRMTCKRCLPVSQFGSAKPDGLRQAVNAQSPLDTLLFYFSGHGQKGADGLSLFTSDAQYATADLLKEFDRDLPTRIVLDCCHAGAISVPPTAGGMP